MNVLKIKLTSASALTFLNYFKEVNIIILTVNASNDDWSAMFMQVLKNSKQLKHIIRFKSDV